MSKESTVSNGKQIFWLAAGRIFAMLITFFMPFFLTRFLTKSEYGIYAQFNSVSLFLMTIFSFGFPTSLYYFVPRSSNDREKRAVVGNTCLALMIGSFLACILLMLPWMQNHVIGSRELLAYLPFLLVSIILFMPTEIMEPLYVTVRDHRISLWYPSVIILIKVFAVILCAVLLKGIKGVLLGVIICDIFLFISTLFYGIWKTDGFHRGRMKDYFSLSLLKKQCLYVYPFGL